MAQNMEDDDVKAWHQHPALRWTYDRLQLCERLCYQCGPSTTKPPLEEQWFIKPRINLLGMGLGAQKYTGQVIPADHFWMPYFEGQHLSVDYKFVENQWAVREVLTVEYDNGRPMLWTRLSPSREYCDIVPGWLFTTLQTLGMDQCNVEFINDNIIEMHLRWGHDFDATAPWTEHAEVVWADHTDDRPYVKNYEDCLGALTVPRLGFRYF